MNSARISIVVIATALVSVVPFITKHEDDVPIAYLDPVKIWTICRGETYNVKAGDTLTKEQCHLLAESRIGQFMFQVVDQLKVEVPSNTLAAHTSFAYNIGINAYKSSKALRLTNAGDIKGGCEAISFCGKDEKGRLGGYGCGFAGGQQLNGLIKRRKEETQLCLAGLQP